MPNHVTNELTASKEAIDFLAGDNGTIDFNKVVPMPEIIRAGSSTPAIEDWAKIAMGYTTVASLSTAHRHPADSFKDGNYGAAADALHQSNVIRMLNEGPFPKDFSDADFETLIKYMRALKQTGHATWFTWAREKWGTKWNAYDADRRSESVVRFDTAWSTPLPVIVALSQKFPADEIRIRWADEDFGNNVGDYTLKNGEPVAGGRIGDHSVEAHAIALELVHDGEVPEDYVMTDGKLEYVES